jgi:hypothetical protein
MLEGEQELMAAIPMLIERVRVHLAGPA